jgi:regulator of RNase E activity RraA
VAIGLSQAQFSLTGQALSRFSTPCHDPLHETRRLGPYKSGPGEIYGTVTLGGVTVNNGDVIVGDADGVVVIPRTRAIEALEAAERVVESEAEQAEAIRSGSWDRSWLKDAVQVLPFREEA